MRDVHFGLRKKKNILRVRGMEGFEFTKTESKSPQFILFKKNLSKFWTCKVLSGVGENC